MRKILFTCIILLAALQIQAAEQRRETNYDEAKVPQYTLPDLLTCNDGTKVTTKRLWEKKRRPEVMEMITSQEYGRTPSQKIKVKYETVAENPTALGGKATSRQVRFTFTGNGRTHEAMLLIFIPNNRKGRVPVIMGYNFQGNVSTCDETDIIESPFIGQGNLAKKIPERGAQKSRWSFEIPIDHGYAAATMYYEDICPDSPSKRDLGIASLFDGYTTQTQSEDEWQAIGAWAWGSSRICDYLCKQRWVDRKRIIIHGHSRLGKAALWAGAQDKRFAVVISNDSGCGGAALSKRAFGETVERINKVFPHWFCPAFRQYGDNEEALPFDQHFLLSLVAPRHLYVNSAEQDNWADPRGEFLSTLAAGSVWKLYDMQGLPSSQFPAIHQPQMGDIGYHIRAGVHDVTDYDWTCWIKFCEKCLH